MGISELWIPSGELIYTSPDFNVHYIEKHGYVPPDVYSLAGGDSTVIEKEKWKLGYGQ